LEWVDTLSCSLGNIRLAEPAGPGQRVFRVAFERITRPRKVKDILEIVRVGVLVAPALAFDGALKSVGKIPELEEMLEWIK
jgi:hypothetical protein